MNLNIFSLGYRGVWKTCLFRFTTNADAKSLVLTKISTVASWTKATTSTPLLGSCFLFLKCLSIWKKSPCLRLSFTRQTGSVMSSPISWVWETTVNKWKQTLPLLCRVKVHCQVFQIPHNKRSKEMSCPETSKLHLWKTSERSRELENVTRASTHLVVKFQFWGELYHSHYSLTSCPHLTSPPRCLPAGCLSGRGQSESEAAGRVDKVLVQQMEEAYSSLPLRLPEVNPALHTLYQDWLQGQDSAQTSTLLHTQYKNQSQSHTQPPHMQWWRRGGGSNTHHLTQITSPLCMAQMNPPVTVPRHFSPQQFFHLATRGQWFVFISQRDDLYWPKMGPFVGGQVQSPFCLFVCLWFFNADWSRMSRS